MISAKSLMAVALVGVLGAAALSIAQPAGVGKGREKSGEQPQPGEPRRGEGRPGEGRQGERGGGASVEGGMKMMNRALKALKTQITDAAKTEENLQLLGEMQRGCVNAKGGKLDKALKEFPEDQRAAKAVEFRREMIELAKVLLDAEEKILDGKLDAAKAALEKVDQMQKKEHEEFKVEED